MTNALVNRSAPWARIVPVLAVEDVRAAVVWYCDVFDVVEHVRIGPGHRAQLGVDGERAELIVREAGDRPPPTGEVMLRVGDVDTVLDAARAAGAVVVQAATEHVYGERQAGIVDPFGHRWTLTQTVRDVAPSDWGGETVVPRRPTRPR